MIMRVLGGLFLVAGMAFLVYDLRAYLERKRSGAETPAYAAGALPGSIGFVLLAVLFLLPSENPVVIPVMATSAFFVVRSLILVRRARRKLLDDLTTQRRSPQ